jgi:hypothetical protein
MMLTFNTLPSALATALLAQARREGRSVHDVALAALEKGLGLNAPAPILADEIDPDTSWAETPAFEQALLAFAELDAGQG